MAEVSIASAVEKLEADTQRERTQGLEELKHILGAGRDVSKVADLKDEGFHGIFESLYRIVRVDKAAYLKATKATTKNVAASRLTSAAAALRLTVESGCSTIKFKTVNSILDHILGTLPTPDDDLCEPLRNDYLKSFRVLLEHAPYAEHLRTKQWQVYVDFLVACISSTLGEAELENGLSASRDSSVSFRTINHLSIRSSQIGVSATSRNTTNTFLDDLLGALRSLSAVPHAPILSRAAQILDAMVAYISQASRVQDIALEIFNNVAFVLLADDITLLSQQLSTLIPHLRRLWSSKISSTRDQILILLRCCRYLLLAGSESVSSIDFLLKDQLLSTLIAEYSNRQPREMLSLDDLSLRRPQIHGTGLHFEPINDSPRAISLWTTVSVLACLVGGLGKSHGYNEGEIAELEQPKKRRKIQTVACDILERAITGDDREKVAAVQVLLFLYDCPTTFPKEIEKDMPRLLDTLLEEDVQLTSWTMILFGRFAMTEAATRQNLQDFWSQAWEFGSRAISSAATVRSACFLLDNIIRLNLLRPRSNPLLIQNSLFPNGTNGPTSFVDTAMVLFTDIINLKVFEYDGALETFSVKVVNWLSLLWTLPSTLDRQHNAQIAFHSQPDFICPLLNALRSTPFEFELVYNDSIPHPILCAEASAEDNIRFSAYFSGEATISAPTVQKKDCGVHQVVDSSLRRRLDRVIFDLLSTKVKEFQESWNTITMGRSSNINPDIIAILSTICIAVLVNDLGQSDVNEIASTLSKQVLALWSSVEPCLVDHNSPSSTSLLPIACSHVLRIRDHSMISSHCIAKSIHPLAVSLLNSIETFSQPTVEIDVLDVDMMDSFATRSSQAALSASQGMSQELARRDQGEKVISHDPIAVYRISLTLTRELAQADGTLGHTSSAAIIDQLLRLTPEQLLSARGSLLDFLNLAPMIHRADINRLLKRLAEICLRDDNFERCEVALCLCLKVMTHLVPTWATDEDDDLGALAFDMYEWYLSIALGKGIASQKVLLYLSGLLDTIIQSNASYAPENLPSPRTSMLNVLAVAGSGLKYRLAPQLSHLFDRYVLSEHMAIFNDIIENLPSDPDNAEGIAARLHVIAELGSQWHTVLRQATYHLFETTANVPSLVKLGSACIRTMCSVLKLNSAQELFRLFAPQIFYTWLDAGALDKMAFGAFDYSSLHEMILDNQTEIAAQIALRGADNHANLLAKVTGSKWETILMLAFPQAEAYCLASDISLPQDKRIFSGSESLIRKQLGSDAYVHSMRDNLPSVMANLLIALEDDQGIERAFEKASYQHALANFRSICDRSRSLLTLPRSQQPSFRAKYLLDEVHYLCARTEFETKDLWEPALLIHVYRSLLEDAKPALGPLHACMIIRKIRIVVSMGGPVSLSGYPLEMLLHNLRPYLTIFHCSEDAVGIYWYLLDRGKKYLQTRLSYLTGLSVSVFASLTSFINSSQDSTTQQSHFIATMTKAQEFKAWLGNYLSTFEPMGTSAEHLTRFKHLVQCAKSMTGPGSNSKSSQEGSVLFELLQDYVSPNPLLTDLHFNLSLGILCKDFVLSAEKQDDITFADEDAVRLTPALKNIVQRPDWNDAFRVWAATAMGRCFAATGSLGSLPESKSNQINPVQGDDLKQASSYMAIVRSLSELLWESNTSSVAAVERTLQVILTAVGIKNFTSVFGSSDDSGLFTDLTYQNVNCPINLLQDTKAIATNSRVERNDHDMHEWAADVISDLCMKLQQDPLLGVLPAFIRVVPEAAPKIFPFVVHLILLSELDGNRTHRSHMSEVFHEVLSETDISKAPICRLVLQTILYLRHCDLPNQMTMFQRNNWLEVDFAVAAAAASRSKMWNITLLFIEIHQSQISLQTNRSSRRSAVANTLAVSSLMSEALQNVDDPDFFYGTHEDSDMSSIILRLSHESAGFKTLSFQSALFDSAIRSDRPENEITKAAQVTAQALSLANLAGISTAVNSFAFGSSASTSTKMYPVDTMNLRDWNILAPKVGATDKNNPLQTLSSLVSASTAEAMISSIDLALLSTISRFVEISDPGGQQGLITQLASLTEAKRIITFTNHEDFNHYFEVIATKDNWMQNESFDKMSPFLQARETIFGSIRRNKHLRDLVNMTLPDSLLLEAYAIRQSLSIAQNHDVSQFCLNRAAYLSELTSIGATLGIKIDASFQYDLARTLWSQDEVSASIQVLNSLRSRQDFALQAIAVNLPEVLTDLGQKVAQARLEKPDEIIANYLIPAIKELKGQNRGNQAGRVFHNFAAFCDSQLQDIDNRDDFERIGKIRERKLLEVQDLERMIKNSDGKRRDQLKHHYSKSRTWFKLDDEEWQRVQTNRESLILRCLENYLLSMKACDDFPNDTLRLLSLWLDRAGSTKANTIVHKYLASVPTRKFAPLMNQLTSRLLDTEDDFQQLLTDLMFRICCDHPFHSLYQVFATSKSKGAQNDEVAASRYAAAKKLAELVKNKSSAGNTWVSVHNSSIAFVRVATEKIADKDLKTGSKVMLRKLKEGPTLISAIEGSSTKIPPPTMKISLRNDRDYSSVPTMAEFQPHISIAGGVSAPKIATIIASDGSRHKMLLKGGNDDLRQDSIMEQVFEQVSNLLKDHRATRQRQLGIRTYKVVPLYPNAGIIEFVQNTIPLHDYLLPAHTRYFPKDYKPNRCRKEIADAQTKPLQQRIQAYRTVTANFHPVMRFFFMDHFLDPDDWFHKRLNYSRSTAAISILGYVLGLGDRHGHNILLDEQTGEVVHIDLGVAFEAGRVLPVPEVVPFRLTRDLVDGMGISGVEGVFRRCCNFTLEALRKEQESIMTILDVLRYDPLYSWSLSPLRLAKMQENIEQAAAAAAASTRMSTSNDRGGAADNAAALAAAEIGAGKRDMNEPNEADRALTVVAKKLGKSLSVEATVNELIRQATDERNLAVLYCGWAAYA